MGGCIGGGAESPARDHVPKLAWAQSGKECHVRLDDLDSIRQSETADEAAEEVGSFRSPVNQSHRQLRTALGNDQARVSSARSQIDEVSGPLRNALDESERSLHEHVQRTLPQYADALGLAQRIAQSSFGISRQKDFHRRRGGFRLVQPQPGKSRLCGWVRHPRNAS